MGLYSTHRYYMGWEDRAGVAVSAPQGKRLRPSLTLLGSDALDGELERALPIATALEYIHNFSLIHDDLEDRDRFRHHRPAIWVLWGDSMAIISGNAMLKLADMAAEKSMCKDVSPATALQVRQLIVHSYLRMMEGQFMDLEYESRTDVSVKQYLAMIERKTGALIEASLYSGAILASESDTDHFAVENLRRVGFEIGRLFQIRDDILGAWGGESTGKPVGSDLRRRKKALPTVHVLNTARGTAKEHIDALFAKEQLNDKDVEDVLHIMEQVGTHQYCIEMARAHCEAALNILERIEMSSRFRKDFHELCEYMISRES